ncbi:MAG TPA: RHS repeat-associated core domain-containing protein, partial [Terriglobales bacterium]|nr:RHS repeat-associated core domain-containing protein [Terriglobales bacterium]
YGEPHEESGTVDRSFTGQNQDIDSSHSGGQYDFLERELSPIQGRWWTPDPAGLAAVDPNNPQSWNRYAYVGGQPLSFVDAFGLDKVCINDGLGTIQCVDTGPGGIAAGGDGGGGGGGTGLCTAIASRAGGFLAAAASPAPCGGTVATGGGGGGGGVGDNSNRITIRTPQGRVCSEYRGQAAFLAEDLAGATSAAASIDVTAQDILGLAAFESGWGANGATRYANNPLGLENGSLFPGASGTWTSRLGATFGVYPSIAANFMAFAHGYGPQVRGFSAPAIFAAALDAGPLHYSNRGEITDAAYIAQVTASINLAADLLSCVQ